MFLLDGNKSHDRIKSDADAIAEVATTGEITTNNMSNIDHAAMIGCQGFTSSSKFCRDARAEGKVISSSNAKHAHGCGVSVGFGQHQTIENFVGCAIAAHSDNRIDFASCYLCQFRRMPRSLRLDPIKLQAEIAQPALDVRNGLLRSAATGLRIYDQSHLTHTDTFFRPRGLGIVL